MVKLVWVRKRIIAVLVSMSMIIAPMLFSVGANPIVAAGLEFTLGSVPTVQNEVVFNTASTATVTTATQFVQAYKNAAISRIILSNDINFSSTDVNDMYTYSLVRSLRIDGQGYSLIFGSFSSVGVFKLGSPSSLKTLHFSNLVFKKNANNGNQIIVQGGTTGWDIIFEQTKNHEGVDWKSIVNGGSGSNYNLFFRGTNGPFKYDLEFWNGDANIIFESNSIITLNRPSNGSNPVFWNTLDFTNVVYFASNSNVTIAGGSAYAIFHQYLRLDIYNGANATLTKSTGTGGTMNASGVSGQQIRVDSNASLKMTNAGGPAYADSGVQGTIVGNPSSSIELVGDSDNGAVYFTNNNSKLIIASPRYFNIQNAKKTKLALSTTSSSSTGAFQFKDTDIAAWALNDNQGQPPLPPSPFNNVSLYSNNGAPLTGSSTATLNTMPGGWRTDKYSRISLSTRPTITATNQTVGVNKTVSINPVVNPTNATVTYVSSNTGIATVSPTGVITGVSVGTTTIRITATNQDGVAVYVDITVTVTNTPPVLTVPAFTHITVGGAFDPASGVSATDLEDGNITGSIVRTGSVNTAVAGLYPIDYTVTDSNGNTVTKKQVVLVNDGNYSVGNNFVIKASSFTKRVSQVNTSDAAINTDAGIQVYSKSTGLLTSETVTFSNKGGYTATPGVYTITMHVTSDPTTIRTITATVTTGNGPTITAPSFTEVTLNGAFDPNTGVSSNDLEDGNITSSIVKTGTVNTAVAGVYIVNYTVSDSDGNQAAHTQVVLVNDGTYFAGNQFILKALDFTKTRGQVNTTTPAVVADSQAIVYSKTTGQVVSQSVGVSNLGGYTNVEGSYPVSLYVLVDSTAARTITATVIAGNFPTITTPGFAEVAVNGTLDLNAGVTASDVEDGNITGLISINGTVNFLVPGVYPIQYQVTDSDGNTTSKTRVILVNDGTYDVGSQLIVHASNFTKRISQVNVGDAAMIVDADVKVYSMVTGLEVADTIVFDSKGGYTNSTGVYNVTLHASSDLSASRTFAASVVAGDVPVITAPTFTEVGVNTSFDPLSGVSVMDTEDGNITGSVNVIGSVDIQTAGVYTLTYSVTDSDGNTSSATHIVLVNDGTYDVGDQYILKAIDFTKRIGQVNTADASIKTDSGVIVYNKSTGLVDPVSVTIDSIGGYTATVGQYPIIMHVSADLNATRSITATVITGQAPQLTVPSITEVEINSSFDPSAGVQALDLEDGNITSSIDITSTVDNTVAGVYVVEYEVTDSDGNIAVAHQVVLINDGNYVIGNQFILRASDFTRRVSQVDATDAGIKTASGTQVFDKATGLLVNEPVVVDNVGNYQALPGAYIISIYVGSDPLAIQNIMATVITGSSPTILAPTFTEIALNDSFDAMAGVSALDLEDGVLTPQVIVNGTVDSATAGFTTLTYSVTDSDLNQTIVTRIVLVNDGTYDVGDTLVVKASDFTRRIGQVNTTDAAIKSAGNIHVYSKTTGLEVNEPITFTSKGGYGPTVGVYTIFVQATNDSQANRDFVGEVVAGSMPSLIVPTFTEITVNAPFDPMAGVSAADLEDGNLTSSIIRFGGVSTNIPGVYMIDYTVTDSDQNSVTLRQVILVNDGTYQVGDQYILRARDFTINAGDVDTSLAAISLAAQVEVFDKATGDPSNQPIQIDDLGGYSSTVQIYTIILSVVGDTNSANAVNANVVTGNLPIIQGPTFTEISIGSVFDPMAGMSVTDIETPGIRLFVTGTVDTNTAGFYTLEYYAEDDDLNKVTYTRVVLVNDGSYDVGDTYVIQAIDFTKRISQVNTSDAALLNDGVVSIYRKATGEIMTTPVTVDKGTYTNAVGFYPITYTAGLDTQATITIQGTVTAGTAPTIANIAFTEVALNGVFDPLNGLSASDTEDGIITNSVVTNNFVNVTVPGLYLVTYSVVDSDGNAEDATQVVLVNDGTYVVGNQYIIQSQDFTRRISEVDTSPTAIELASQIKVFDKNTGVQVNTPVNIVDTNGYQAVAGLYQITFEVTAEPLTRAYVDATVSAGQNPSIIAPTFAIVMQNNAFNIMTGVVASDFEDGILTSSITTSGTLDTSVPGFYRIDYVVVDSDGNMAQAYQIILVNDGTYDVGDTYVLQAQNFTRRVGQVDNSVNGVMTDGQVKVYEKSTGMLSGQPVTIDNLGGYDVVVGIYPISMHVDGDLNANRDIQATVIAGEKPTITATSFTEVPVNGVFDPLNGMSVLDAEDGSLTSAVLTTNLVNVAIPGMYLVTYSVVDSDGNHADATQVVLVNDGTYQVGLNYVVRAVDFVKRVSEVNTTQLAVLLASQTQVFSKATGLEVSGMAFAAIGSYQAVVGVYPISINVFGDVLAKRTINAEVVTGGIPILTAPSFTEIQQGNSFDILLNVSANDLEDLNITSSINTSGTVDTMTPGLYKVDYTVIDSDQNSVTASQIVLVNDGTYVVGSQFILHANDFTRRISQVDTSDAAILLISNAEVYSKTTGLIVNEPLSIDDLGGYSATQGVYPITIELANDATLDKVVNATVTPGIPPTLVVPSLVELAQDTAYNPMTGVSATDTETGDISSQITVSGILDTHVPGVYVLNFEVKDQDNNAVSASEVVLVNDGTYEVGDQYIIHAENFTKRVGEVNTMDPNIIMDAGLRLYDRVTGQLVSKAITVTKVDPYQPVPGAYRIQFVVNDDPTTSITIIATVVAGEAPVLTVPYFRPVDLNGIYDPMAGVSTMDLEDGNLETSISIVGSVDTSVAGFHTMTYNVVDSDGNQVTKKQVVLVNDGTYAIGLNYVVQAKEYTIRVSEVDMSPNVIKTQADVKVFNKATGELTTQPAFISNLGGYQPVVGSYPISFQIMGDIIGTRTILANVIAGNAPTIEAPVFTELTLNQIFDSMSDVVALDLEDGNLTSSVVVTGIVDVAKAGLYVLDYQVTDADGNTATARRIVLVNDGSYSVGGYYILKANPYTIATGDVTDPLNDVQLYAQPLVYDKATAQLVNKTVQIFDAGGYTGVVGQYTMVINLLEEPSTTKEVIATVINGNLPVINAETFTEVKLNSIFDPLLNVTASDQEDGDVTASLSVQGQVNTSIAGVYTLEYAVTDSDGNSTTLRRVVLVNDGHYVVDNDYIINARDFTINYADYKNDTLTKSLAKVKVYSTITGEQLVDPTLTIQREEITNKQKTRQVTFMYNPQITVTATIVYQNLPDTGNDSALAIVGMCLILGGAALMIILERYRKYR